MLINVIGCDPSLTHTALHHVHGRLHESASFADASDLDLSFARESLKFPVAKFPHAVARLYNLRASLETWLTQRTAVAGVGLLVVEGYAFGAMYNREALGEWGGVLRVLAYSAGWDLLVVPPAALKRFVLGKGVGEKNLMLREVSKRYAYDATDDDDCDAYALMQLGVQYQRWGSCDPMQHVPQKWRDLFEPKPVKKRDKEKMQASVELLRAAT